MDKIIGKILNVFIVSKKKIFLVLIFLELFSLIFINVWASKPGVFKRSNNTLSIPSNITENIIEGENFFKDKTLKVFSSSDIKDSKLKKNEMPSESVASPLVENDMFYKQLDDSRSKDVFPNNYKPESSGNVVDSYSFNDMLDTVSDINSINVENSVKTNLNLIQNKFNKERNMDNFDHVYNFSNVSILQVHPSSTLGYKTNYKLNKVDFRINPKLSKRQKRKIENRNKLEREFIEMLDEAGMRSSKSHILDIYDNLDEGDVGAYVTANSYHPEVICEKPKWSTEVSVNKVEIKPMDVRGLPIQYIVMKNRPTLMKSEDTWVSFNFARNEISDLIKKEKLFLPKYFPLNRIYPNYKLENDINELKGYLVCINKGDPLRFLKKSSTTHNVMKWYSGAKKVAVKDIEIQNYGNKSYSALVSFENLNKLSDEDLKNFYDEKDSNIDKSEKKLEEKTKITSLVHVRFNLDMYNMEKLQEIMVSKEVCELDRKMNESGEYYFDLVCPHVFLNINQRKGFPGLKNIEPATKYGSAAALFYLAFCINVITKHGAMPLIFKIPVFRYLNYMLTWRKSDLNLFGLPEGHVLHGVKYKHALALFSWLLSFIGVYGLSHFIGKFALKVLKKLYFKRTSKKWFKEIQNNSGEDPNDAQNKTILLIHTNWKNRDQLFSAESGSLRKKLNLLDNIPDLAKNKMNGNGTSSSVS